MSRLDLPHRNAPINRADEPTSKDQRPSPVWACARIGVWVIAGMLTMIVLLLMVSVQFNGLPGRFDVVCAAAIIAIYTLARAATFLIDNAASLFGVKSPGP